MNFSQIADMSITTLRGPGGNGGSGTPGTPGTSGGFMDSLNGARPMSGFGGGWLHEIIEGAFTVAILAVLLAVGIWAFKKFMATRSPEAVLAKRLAAGEIDLASYQHLRTVVANSDKAGAQAAARAATTAAPAATTVWSTNPVEGEQAEANTQVIPSSDSETQVLPTEEDGNAQK